MGKDWRECIIKAGCRETIWLNDQLEENKKIRWLRLLVDSTVARLYQDETLVLHSARELVWQIRHRVLEVFPGKETTFDLVLLPRFDRVLKERWGEGVDSVIN